MHIYFPNKNLDCKLISPSQSITINNVQMVLPCVYKSNGQMWELEFWMVLNGVSAVAKLSDHSKPHQWMVLNGKSTCSKETPKVGGLDQNMMRLVSYKMFVLKRHWAQLSKTSVLTWCIPRMHIITNLWKYVLNWSSKLQENNEEKKTPLSHTFCVLSDVS